MLWLTHVERTEHTIRLQKSGKVNSWYFKDL